jgi:hypothetical protein
MRSFGEYMAHVAKCQKKADIARNEEDGQAWLALADGWLRAAELKAKLQKQDKQAA